MKRLIIVIFFISLSNIVVAKDMESRNKLRWLPNIKMAINAGYYKELTVQCEFHGYGNWEKIPDLKGVLSTAKKIKEAENIVTEIVNDSDFESDLNDRIRAYYTGMQLAKVSFDNLYPYIKADRSKVMWYCRSDMALEAKRALSFEPWM
ncbi:hypothetical protein [Marinomonas sp.]